MYVIFIYPLGLALAYLLFFRLALPLVFMTLVERIGIRHHAGALGLFSTAALWCGLLYLASTGFGRLIN
ncbi:hypothetical protein B5P46_11715 [Rhizobium leguminosarum]|uniref:Uncharacterized protein n=1 Tax=Rhizobium leguminosarum TaxID=384 RepID=A0A4Q1UBG5_RHILE|nr:hypothetical protein [Rhizobium leguminosarum]RXT29342.1 hypothetical protein B5P46_11715 [Rhizobium leguminosarum]